MRVKTLHKQSKMTITWTWKWLSASFFKGFQVLPWRWIVERTLAWTVRHRRLTIDYEARPATAEAFIYAAMVGVMVRRLA